MTLGDLKKLITQLATEGLQTDVLQAVALTIERNSTKRRKVDVDHVLLGIAKANDLFQYEHGFPLYATPGGDLLLAVAKTIQATKVAAEKHGETPEPVILQA